MTLTRHLAPPAHQAEAQRPAGAALGTRALLAWFVAGAVLAFAVAWVGADLLRLQRDLYYLVYVTVVVSFVLVFVARSQLEWRGFLRHRLLWSLGIGAVLAVGAVRNVYADPATDGPDGARLVFEVAWRGVTYGLVDVLILYAFPAAVAWLLLRGNLAGIGRKLGFAGLTLALVTVITATYHVGYAQFRDSDLREPEIGAVVSSVPTLLTANPAGAAVVHVGMHVSAVLHEYDGPSFLPPSAYDEPARLDGAAAGVAAGVWILLTGLVWWVFGDRLLGRGARTRPHDRQPTTTRA